ncbi:hypothetical protein [Streptomyces sp. SP2-10]|uniref:hypothetical protein n=1 Tax=Streptomyces sp. SP2-10 TaxID=2873385 RepID=UPI00223BD515|nr:hypothetical protein [Streptomyces sp. SP2-10]
MIAQDAGRLRPAAAHHLTYHHGLEVVFTDTGFVSCPAAFQEPRFREPTVEETARPRRTLGETPSAVVAFEADGGGPEPVSCLTAAEDPEIRPGFVPGHPRAGAQAVPGPRDWPGPPLPTD